MFSRGQIIFSIFFIVVFTIAIVIVYRRDLLTLGQHYKGNRWILLSILLFITILFGVKFLLKK